MKKLLTTLLLGVGLALLAGCGTATAPSAETPAKTVAATRIMVASETATAAPTATEEAKDSCVDCHTDKQMLIDTAKPEEVKESESEGVG